MKMRQSIRAMKSCSACGAKAARVPGTLLLATFFVLLTAAPSNPEVPRGLAGTWEYTVHFSTADGGGTHEETLVLGSRNTFEYRINSRYYSSKNGNTTVAGAWKGSCRIQDKRLIFTDMVKTGNAKTGMLPEWEIIEVRGDTLTLKPLGKPAEGGYQRIYRRKR